MTEEYIIFNCEYREICTNTFFLVTIVTQVIFFLYRETYQIFTKTSSLAMCSPQAQTSPPNTFGDCSKYKRHSKYQFCIKLTMHQHVMKVRYNMVGNNQLYRKSTTSNRFNVC